MEWIIPLSIIGFIIFQGYNRKYAVNPEPSAITKDGMIQSHLITTNFQLDGYRIVETIGVVRGITVRSRNIFGNFFGVLRMIFGGNISGFEKLCDTAREHAYLRMIEHAEEKGANAVIGFRYDATELMRGLTEVLAYGTACKVEKI